MHVPPALAHCKGTCPGDHPIVFEIGFIAHYDQWYLRVVLDADNLVAKFVKLGERAEGGDGEDEEEALAGFHVEFSHCSYSPSKISAALDTRSRSLTELLCTSGI